MALLSSSCSHFLHPNSSRHISKSPFEQALKTIMSPSSALCKDRWVNEQKQLNNAAEGKEWNRRELLSHAVLASSASPLVALASENEKFRIYTDEANMFTITIPEDWQIGNGKGDGVKSVIAFYPPEETSGSNVSIVITGLGADFTRLGSFGKVDAFAENLIGGLDRSWQRPPGVAAKLIDSKAANGLYYIDYTLKKPGETRRNLLTVLGISNNGYYNRLYTLTGQFSDEEKEKFSDKIRKVVSSFRLN